MSPDILFKVCNSAVLPGWFLLAVCPRWTWGSRLVCPVVIPGLLGMLYIGLMAMLWNRLNGSFDSLSGVEQLFTNRYALVGGWIHYLAFDLFIGSWEVRDSQRLGLSHWLVLPCLAMTCLFGPAGLVLYLGLRSGVRKKLLVGTDPAKSATD